MRCYYVLLHGMLEWSVAFPSDEVWQPRGFFCHRYVLAIDQARAVEIACHRVRQNLDRDQRWVSDGRAMLRLEAEEVWVAPFHKLLKPINSGHAFYAED